MNIQIFGKAKCFETKKALRYFKERKIPVQYIDLTQKPMSKGEYRSVKTAVGGWQAMVNEKAKGYEDCYLPYLAYEEDVDEKILGNQGILKLRKFIFHKKYNYQQLFLPYGKLIANEIISHQNMHDENS